MASIRTIESHALNLNMDEIWYQRFCHTSHETIRRMTDGNKMKDLTNIKDPKFICDACWIGKATKTPYKKLKERQTEQVCELIHSSSFGQKR